MQILNPIKAVRRHVRKAAHGSWLMAHDKSHIATTFPLPLRKRVIATTFPLPLRKRVIATTFPLPLRKRVIATTFPLPWRERVRVRGDEGIQQAQ